MALIDWVRLLLEFVVNVAWPAAAVMVALSLRGIVRDLAARIIEAEGWGVRLRFETKREPLAPMDVVDVPPIEVLDASRPEGERPSS